jgi:hypothetical protein
VTRRVIAGRIFTDGVIAGSTVARVIECGLVPNVTATRVARVTRMCDKIS